MEEQTKIKTSLVNSMVDSKDHPDSTDQAREISPPSNLPKETSRPIPVPVVSHTSDETGENQKTPVEEKVTGATGEDDVKAEGKGLKTETEESLESSGPLDFKTLKPEPETESEPSEPEPSRPEPETKSSEPGPEPPKPPEKEETSLPIKISTTVSPSSKAQSENQALATGPILPPIAKKEDPFTSKLKDIRQGRDQNQNQKPVASNAKPVKPKIRKTIFLLIGTLIFLTAGVGAYFYFNDSPTEQPDAFDLEIKPATNEAWLPEEQTPTAMQTEGQLTLTAGPKTIEISTLQELNEKIIEFKTIGILGENLTQLIPTLNGEAFTLNQLKEALGLVIPVEIAKSDKRFALLTIKEGEIVKTGLVIETTSSPELVKSQMLEWEKTMVGDLEPLLLGEIAEDPANPEDFRFRDSSKFPNGRFIGLSKTKNISIDYSILADKILIGTSYLMVEELVKTLAE